MPLFAPIKKTKTKISLKTKSRASNAIENIISPKVQRFKKYKLPNTYIHKNITKILMK